MKTILEHEVDDCALLPESFDRIDVVTSRVVHHQKASFFSIIWPHPIQSALLSCVKQS